MIGIIIKNNEKKVFQYLIYTNDEYFIYIRKSFRYNSLFLVYKKQLISLFNI